LSDHTSTAGNDILRRSRLEQGVQLAELIVPSDKCLDRPSWKVVYPGRWQRYIGRRLYDARCKLYLSHVPGVHIAVNGARTHGPVTGRRDLNLLLGDGRRT